MIVASAKGLNLPVTLGALRLRNRVLMAPLTRCRAEADGTPTAMMAEYYAQRASAGLIIAEATNVAASSCAFERSPGLWDARHVAGWRRVTDAVHAKGGSIMVQLWHAGRVGASRLLGGRAPLSPSGIDVDLLALQVWGTQPGGTYGRLEPTASQAMTEGEIAEVIHAYGRATRLALEAGFDGVEVHAANGYLPHQFMSPTLNQRADAWGGDVTRRLRFLSEVVDATVRVAGASRVAVRISPFARYNDVRDSAPNETAVALGALLDKHGLAFVHLADTNAWGGQPDLSALINATRAHYRGPLVGNGGISPSQASALVCTGTLDAVAFGRSFVANPDLPRRIFEGAPLQEVDGDTLYGGDARGYSDYLAMGSASPLNVAADPVPRSAGQGLAA